MRACSFVGTARLTRVHMLGKKFVNSSDRACAEFGGDFLRALGICIHDADKLRAFGFAPHASVVAPPEFPNTNHRNANGFLAQDFPFWLAESGAKA